MNLKIKQKECLKQHEKQLHRKSIVQIAALLKQRPAVNFENDET
ncbi:hypothetical protein QEJ31_03260 [Pigmentibacter sp. JX0631]|nr:hypothetical protein [Pigmentibacter sp. JX0631]WGL60620.1 hypothetical protein QEJ31_03260 [Pigmentibacter sp. JX0631]